MMKRRTILLALVLVFATTTADAATNKAFSWDTTLRKQYPTLFICEVPSQLRPWKLKKTNSGFPKKVASVLAPVNDGCTVTVYENPKTHLVILAVSGGFNGQIHFLLGPFHPDGSDL